MANYMKDWKFRCAELTAADVQDVVQIHIEAFPGFFMTKLGRGFLRAFYSCYVGESLAIAVVIKSEKEKVCGFAVGSIAPKSFFRALLLRAGHRLGWSAAVAACRNPDVMIRLVRAILYRGPKGVSIGGALLSSIAMDPHFAGMGGGQILIDDWCRRARLRGVTECFLTTDAVANNRVIAFYERNGWKKDCFFITREKRGMYLMKLNLNFF